MDTKFLRELIENNTRVILPEFGAFLVKDDGSGVFNPKNITFSPFLRYNDGMVEDALASAKSVSKDEARKLIDKYTETIKDDLSKGKSVPLEGLGFLHADSKGSIHFTQKDSPSQAKTKEEKPKPLEKSQKSAAKPKIEDVPPSKVAKQEPEKRDDDKSKTETPKEPVSNRKPDSSTSEKTTQETPKKVEKPKVESKPKEETKPKTQIKPKEISKPITGETRQGTGTGKAILAGTLVGVCLVIAVVGGWYLYNSDIFDFSKDKNKNNFSENEVKTSITKESEDFNDEAENTSDESQGKFDDEFSELSEEIDNEASENDTESVSVDLSSSSEITDNPEDITITYPKEGMFHIIVGSFRNKTYAEKFSNDMQNSGFNSRIISQKTGMHAVTLGSFLTRKEAVDSMNVWKKEHPNVWILSQ